jgi:hypothetical protein
VEVDVSKNSAYGSGWVDVVRTGIGGESLSVELEIQTNDVGNVSNALEEALLFAEHLRGQIAFWKPRLIYLHLQNR